MPITSVSGSCFVAFLDISGFKKKIIKSHNCAVNILKQFYQAGYDALKQSISESAELSIIIHKIFLTKIFLHISEKIKNIFLIIGI
jgi:hypothetical protein